MKCNTWSTGILSLDLHMRISILKVSYLLLYNYIIGYYDLNVKKHLPLILFLQKFFELVLALLCVNKASSCDDPRLQPGPDHGTSLYSHFLMLLEVNKVGKNINNIKGACSEIFGNEFSLNWQIWSLFLPKHHPL